MVEEGIGVTLLPSLATDAGVTGGHDVHLSELVGATPRRVVLAWRQSAAQTQVFQEVAQTLRATRDSLKAASDRPWTQA
jgi:LysR family hydrogen peroxide-inducible transcriptional activator